MSTEDERPEILRATTEQELLYQLLVGEVSRVVQHTLRPEATVGDDAEVITSMILTGLLRNLRVLSARQLAVLLAQEADRRAGHVIREPPRYSAEEIGNVR